MNVTDAQKIFEQRVANAGIDLARLTLPQGIQLMLDFYREVRAEQCPVEDDGDMLLFQWGTFDWGTGSSFQCAITRQFMQLVSEDYDSVSQLSLRFHFPSSAELNALNVSNYWCQAPDDLPDFEAVITGSEPYRAVGRQPPSSVELAFSEV